MIPILPTRPGRNLTLWQEHQQQAWNFSEGDEVTTYIGELLAQSGGGLSTRCARDASLFLDVGCGTLPCPGYMAAAGSDITWIGIDPLPGDAARRFPFAHGLGEYLPFRDCTFDGVLYASTIYHQMDPRRSLERARRAIRPGGKLYIWYESDPIDWRYITWRIRQALGRPRHFTKSARWAFTRSSLRLLLKRAGFAVEEEVLLCVKCPGYATCRTRTAFLMIDRCE